MNTRSVFFRGFIVVLIVVGVSLTPFGTGFFDRVRSTLIDIVYIGQDVRMSILGNDVVSVEGDVAAARLLDIERENNELRTLLAFKERFDFEGLGADVLSRSYDPTRAHLIVNRGEEDGIERGAPVVVGDGVLVGIVEKVMLNTSVVQLLIDPASKVAGRLLNDQQSEGVVAGGHGIVVRVELIPRDEDIPLDTALVTSGLDQSVARGLLIGKVVAVEQDTSSLFNRAIVETPVDYQKITQVFIAASSL